MGLDANPMRAFDSESKRSWEKPVQAPERGVPMSRYLVALLLGWPLCGSSSADPPDLSGVDRGIAKEPAYRSRPRYLLLVFGLRADTRVWLVEDGETIYVDRNANGDLTEPGEAVAPSHRREFNTSQDGLVVP